MLGIGIALFSLELRTVGAVVVVVDPATTVVAPFSLELTTV